MIGILMLPIKHTKLSRNKSMSRDQFGPRNRTISSLFLPGKLMPIMKHGKKKREIKELLLMLKPLKMLLKQKRLTKQLRVSGTLLS